MSVLAIAVLDRGYMDFVRLDRLHKGGGYFVVRCKEPVSFRILDRRMVRQFAGFKCDQTVRLKSNWSEKSFPEALRKVRLFDSENKIMLVLLTNNFSVSLQTVAQFYQQRGRVELFFQWIKQHLRLRAFYGRSENAVRCQIWISMCAYLLVAILKKQLGITKTLNEILQICGVNIFEQALPQKYLQRKPMKTRGLVTDSIFRNTSNSMTHCRTPVPRRADLNATAETVSKPGIALQKFRKTPSKHPRSK